MEDLLKKENDGAEMTYGKKTNLNKEKTYF